MTENSDVVAKSPINTTPMAHERILLVLLMDDGMQYGHVQRELLATAKALRSTGFVVHVLCPEHSALVHKATAEGFIAVPIPPKKQGFISNYITSVRLLWKYDKNSPLCIHTFSATYLPLIKSFAKRRLQNVTVVLYSCFHKDLSVKTTSFAMPQKSKPKAISDNIPSEGEELAQSSEDVSASTDSSNKPEIKCEVQVEETGKNFSQHFSKLSALTASADIAEKVIIPSSFVRNAWSEIKMDASRLKVIHTAFPRQESTPSERQGKRFVFLVLADFAGSPEQDVMDTVYKAMLNLQDAKASVTESPEWEVRIMGAEQRLGAYVEKAKSLGIANRLTLLTSIDGNFPLEDVLPGVHALVLPQNTPEGNMPAFLAAWSYGLPIIASKVSGHLELVELADRTRIVSKSALKSDQVQLILPDDEDSLTEAMRELLCNKARYDELATASFAMSPYADMSRLQQNYLDIYRDCISARGWVLPKKN